METNCITVGELPEINPQVTVSNVNIHGKHNLYFWDTSSYGCFSMRQTNKLLTGSGSMDIAFGDTTFNNTHTHDITINKFGNNKVHNNMQPYTSVYIWKRIA